VQNLAFETLWIRNGATKQTCRGFRGFIITPNLV